MPGNNRFDMGDYVEVNERIVAFKEKYPEGSLQAEVYSLSDSLVVMKAYAYRTPDDIRPGIGWSSLQIPGSTPYTKGSEVENCETSAWGRAIAALGFAVKRGIASRHEVESKRAEAPTVPRVKEPKALETRPCPHHEGQEQILSPSTGNWGHVLEDGAMCVDVKEKVATNG